MGRPVGDYGFRICSTCGKDVLWEEAFYMKEDVVCCSETCYDRHRLGKDDQLEESRNS